MNAETAKLLRNYARAVIPPVAQRKFPNMTQTMYRLLKKWWTEKMSHADRAVLRQHAKLNMPLPDDLKAEARSRGLIVEWPPQKKEQK